jgi:hypothetical protein
LEKKKERQKQRKGWVRMKKIEAIFCPSTPSRQKANSTF